MNISRKNRVKIIISVISSFKQSYKTYVNIQVQISQSKHILFVVTTFSSPNYLFLFNLNIINWYS